MTTKLKIGAISILILLCGIAFANNDTDNFIQYIGQNVSVNVCNLTMYQGILINDFPDTIVIREVCNPELGNVAIRKSCIIAIRSGCQCITS